MKQFLFALATCISSTTFAESRLNCSAEDKFFDLRFDANNVLELSQQHGPNGSKHVTMDVKSFSSTWPMGKYVIHFEHEILVVELNKRSAKIPDTFIGDVIKIDNKETTLNVLSCKALFNTPPL